MLNELERRDFLGLLAGLAAAMPTYAADGMIYRKFGSAGEKVSAIGLGGYHIGTIKDEAESIKLMRTAIDRGMNFMDNCWSYHDGKSEVWMGKALRDGYRNKVFLMTKFDSRSKQGTLKQIDECLQRLQTDRIDLMQYHENIRLDDPDRFFNNGPAEALLEAKKAGKIRYLGYTGHKDPFVHVRMLELAARHNFKFNAAQMPLSPLDAHFRSFANDAVPKLVKAGVAVLAMKTLAGGHALKSGAVTAPECLNYALSLPTTTVITGIESTERLNQALQVAANWKPMTKEQMTTLMNKTREVALTGKFEPFKTTPMYDGTVHNPSWMV